MKLFVIFILLATVLNSFGALNNYKAFNESINDALSRQKRFLVYPPSTGTSRINYVASYLGPIDIPLWQNINCGVNFQYQYPLPPNWTTKFPVFPGLWSRRSNGGRSLNDGNVKIKPDSSRKIAYEIIEEMLNRENKNGRECLLLTICQVAETPLSHNGLIGELLEIFFTPGKHEIIEDDYQHARKAGLNHVNCEKLYPGCPFGHGLLDSFSIVQNFHFDNILNF